MFVTTGDPCDVGFGNLGNLAVQRDWGWAPDYTRAMVLAAEADPPDDYVVATGEAHSLSDLIATAFAHVGISDWDSRVMSNSGLFRPADAETPVGDATRLRTRLGWAATVGFEQIVAAMVAPDCALLKLRQPSRDGEPRCSFSFWCITM